MLLPLGLSALPAGQLLYLTHPIPFVKSTFRFGWTIVSLSRTVPVRGNFTILSLPRSLSNRTLELVGSCPIRRWCTAGASHHRPGGQENSRSFSLRWEVVHCLRGRDLPALRSSLWGEQEVIYAAWAVMPNHWCIPGVSRVFPRCFAHREGRAAARRRPRSRTSGGVVCGDRPTTARP